MGVLRDHDLNHYITTYGLGYFVETGLGIGTGLSHACGLAAFKKLWSCDIDADQIAALRPRYAHDSRVDLFAGKSTDYLTRILPQCTGNTLFFLDAHFPSADIGKKAFDAEKDLNLRLPLVSELELIGARRATHKDVVIVDDISIYMTDDWEDGSLERRGYGYLFVGNEQLSPVINQWSATHNWTVDKRKSGYLLLTPKTAS